MSLENDRGKDVRKENENQAKTLRYGLPHTLSASEADLIMTSLIFSDNVDGITL